ncbi:glutamate-5-semialdehyde dehydrogenase [Coemansia sp. RSA 989]|nr:glutamate-5-semialdehyde dehydrogenase [Coemansia mojavensis]KAJ1739797.1 glutamate-5-semialdehyde dehydrogenase [Coemansia sp. RSA 1086]KAJ1748229.1 glutamate-5-semialdehyde dehydrogenase [Coemansia sp. RSA 1821]KAJ1862371.1 glutamate-5-semialdehyde dehydrogenase [Coemansia sp. RSA 989]KAJ1870206.1 glutamate-5-semialdehyde dehydrogenase [Coemansia sp. RSA 990]KAJ2669003.1 glutamate-5-semialdehyde dehydrogenase [Coemansia sp. RSA 1085]
MTAEQVARSAREASNLLQTITSAQKSAVLRRIRQVLEERRDQIVEANRQDKEAAQKEVDAGRLSSALFKRLDIEGAGGEKYSTLLQGVDDVDRIPDPIGQVTMARKLDNELDLYRVVCPVGVCLVIFEARPEVVVNIACLAIKSGNAAILKGGKEATRTNQALAEAIQHAIATTPTQEGQTQFPERAVQVVSTRDEINSLLDMDRYVDLVIPRGSNSLVRHIQNNTRIPVLGHADGICSTYLDASADVKKAVHTVVDAKTHYPAACNATETLLVHSSVLDSVFVPVARALQQANVRIHADQRSLAAMDKAGIRDASLVSEATDADFGHEYTDMDIAVCVVDSLDEAIDHINAHGSKHTDAIITENAQNAQWFMRRVDAAGVYWNASTRFADGFRYGFGTEIGVSTNKTHARGPAGLEGLTIYKYYLFGNGQGAGDFGVGPGKHPFLHQDIPLDDTVRSKFVL